MIAARLIPKAWICAMPSALFLFTCDGVARGQCGTWVRVALPAQGPQPSRVKATIGYDEARERVVLFGGYNSGYLKDTWEWDGNVWQLASAVPSAGLTGRMDASMAFHPGLGKLLMYGGYSVTTMRNTHSGLFAWQGNDWTSLELCTIGGVVYGGAFGAMAFNEATGQLYVHRGIGSVTGGQVNTTNVVWNGTTWSLAPPPPIVFTPQCSGPIGQLYASVAFDPIMGAVVVTGGEMSNLDLCSSIFVAETWRYDDPTWTQLANTPCGAGQAGDHDMVYHKALNRLVCIPYASCATIGYSRATNTWTSIGGWFDVQLSTYYSCCAAYDTARERIVVYNGSLGTFEFVLNAGVARVVGQPASAVACIGGEQTFEITATGDNLQYQWFRNGTPIGNGLSPVGSTVSGATTPLLTISNVQLLEAGSFWCVASNNCGSNQSQMAELEVQLPASPADFDLIAPCLAGPDLPNPGCNSAVFLRADFDEDGDNDLADFADFQRRVGVSCW